ncbi:MAG: thioether cross-link-forming SCIFF peptide maturase [Clostridia bacterium]|nr:thioether cross-link-forming SCIFF peptide maturase [Clostridia bacterium]
MIHQYKLGGYNIVLDICSGSVHVVDDIAYDIIALYESKAKDEILSEMEEKYLSLDGVTREDILDCFEQVEELKESGKLFTPDTFEPMAPKLKAKTSGVIKALCMHIAHTCNLNCEYCFASQGKYHGERAVMSFEVGKRALDFLVENSGTRHNLEVDFFGGEPLMNFDVLKRTVYYAKEAGEKAGKKFLFTTTTNALLLNDEVIKFFNEEMENVVLSLDGRKEVHDAIRKTINGKGTFDLIIDKIKNFIALRGEKSYYVRGTFTAKNLDFAKDVLFIADQGVDSISMEPVVTEIEDLQIKDEHLPRIEEEYENLCDAYLERYAKGQGFNFFHFNVDLEGGPCLSKRVSACGAGNEYFSVAPNGDLYPCHQFVGDDKFRMGSVTEGITRTDIREEFKNSCLFTRKKCGDCFAKFICSGGCNANNYHYNGDINDPYEVTCGMMKKRIECAMHILAEKKLLK